MLQVRGALAEQAALTGSAMHALSVMEARLKTEEQRL